MLFLDIRSLLVCSWAMSWRRRIELEDGENEMFNCFLTASDSTLSTDEEEHLVATIKSDLLLDTIYIRMLKLSNCFVKSSDNLYEHIYLDIHKCINTLKFKAEALYSCHDRANRSCHPKPLLYVG